MSDPKKDVETMDVDEQAEKPMEEDEPVAAAANENPKSPVAGPSSATNIGMFFFVFLVPG